MYVFVHINEIGAVERTIILIIIDLKLFFEGFQIVQRIRRTV